MSEKSITMTLIKANEKTPDNLVYTKESLKNAVRKSPSIPLLKKNKLLCKNIIGDVTLSNNKDGDLIGVINFDKNHKITESQLLANIEKGFEFDPLFIGYAYYNNDKKIKDVDTHGMSIISKSK